MLRSILGKHNNNIIIYVAMVRISLTPTRVIEAENVLLYIFVLDKNNY